MRISEREILKHGILCEEKYNPKGHGEHGVWPMKEK